MMTRRETQLLEDAPCGLFHARDDGCLLRVNDYLGRIAGRDPDTLCGAFFDRVLTPPSRVVFHTHVVPVLKLDGAIDSIELTLRCPDGSETDALLNAVRDSAGGEPAVVRGALFPLRARRQLQSQLVNAQRLIESLPGLVFQIVVDEDGSTSIPYANDALQELHGVTAESVRLVAEPFWKSVHPDDVDALRARLMTAARELTPCQTRYRTCPRGTTRLLDCRAAPQPLPNGSVLFCAYSYDVTEQAHLEELAREKLVAERASEAKTRFLARVNHEMRSPLTAILGFTSLLKAQSNKLDEQSQFMVRNLELAGKSMLELVNELLEISRIESGAEALQPEPLELQPVVAAVLDLMQPVASASNVTLDVAVPSGLYAFADARRLKQALINLISNAIKYNRAEGFVYVRAARQGERVCVSVRDEGKGIGPDQIANLFQPFNRLGIDQEVAGTGLGLVIARTLLEHMGGAIRVTSTEGQGSSFTAELPAHEVVEAPSAPTQR